MALIKEESEDMRIEVKQETEEQAGWCNSQVFLYPVFPLAAFSLFLF